MEGTLTRLTLNDQTMVPRPVAAMTEKMAQRKSEPCSVMWMSESGALIATAGYQLA